jgi:hypothetical protein
VAVLWAILSVHHIGDPQLPGGIVKAQRKTDYTQIHSLTEHSAVRPLVDREHALTGLQKSLEQQRSAKEQGRTALEQHQGAEFATALDSADLTLSPALLAIDQEISGISTKIRMNTFALARGKEEREAALAPVQVRIHHLEEVQTYAQELQHLQERAVRLLGSTIVVGTEFNGLQLQQAITVLKQRLATLQS